MKTLSGSCHCGNIKFQIIGEIFGFKHCHCKSCRKVHGTAFASNAIVNEGDFKLLSDEKLLHDYHSSPGKIVRFCKNCCSQIYAYMPENPGEIYIRLGMLDDEPDVKAEYHWWVQDKAAWYDIHDTLPQFSTVPSGKY